MAGIDAGGTGALRQELLRGLVIPAHPLALTEKRTLDEQRQIALTRYYCDAGAGGIAKLFRSHPPTEERIKALMAIRGVSL